MGRYLAALAALACLLGAAAVAAEPAPVQFGHGDWSLQCDNSGSCRAEGYASEDGDSPPVSMLLTRAAGPDAALQIEWQVLSEASLKGELQLGVGAQRVAGRGEGVQRVPPAQVPALLAEMLRAREARVRSAQAGRGPWRLSLTGLNAVLLKMDEAQGRLDTPGALVRRGSRAESAVPPAAPVPQLKRVRPLPTRAADAALLRALLAAVPAADVADQCNDSGLERDQGQVFRLDEQRVLLAVPCPQGAYNGTTLLWQARERPPYQLQLQQAHGDFDPRTGQVSSQMKGRGLGDCWSSQVWQFDGQGFVLARESSTGLCRGFPGGAWDLPSYVTR